MHGRCLKAVVLLLTASVLTLSGLSVASARSLSLSAAVTPGVPFSFGVVSSSGYEAYGEVLGTTWAAGLEIAPGTDVLVGFSRSSAEVKDKTRDQDAPHETTEESTSFALNIPYVGVRYRLSGGDAGPYVYALLGYGFARAASTHREYDDDGPYYNETTELSGSGLQYELGLGVLLPVQGQGPYVSLSVGYRGTSLSLSGNRTEEYPLFDEQYKYDVTYAPRSSQVVASLGVVIPLSF